MYSFASRILGGEVVTEPEQATHIVLTRLVRTSKLLMAVCTVDHVLNSRWISDSAKAGKFLPTNEYVWHDNLFNELYNCDIQTAIKSPKRRSLLSGKIFYITPSVRPQPKDLIKIIELCGGKVELKRRSASQIEQANAEQPESYIILTCTKDIHLLVDLTKPGKPNRIICATEYVLSAIMQQKLELEPYIITYFWYWHRNSMKIILATYIYLHQFLMFQIYVYEHKYVFITNIQWTFASQPIRLALSSTWFTNAGSIILRFVKFTQVNSPVSRASSVIRYKVGSRNHYNQSIIFFFK